MAGFAALLAYFYNIAHIPLGDAMTYSKTAPIFTAILAWIFLKEKLSVFSWMAVFVGFAGIVFIANPTEMGFSKYDLLGIFSGIGAAFAYTSIRELKNYYDSRSIVLSFTLVGTVAPLMLFGVSHFFYIEELDFLLGEFVMPSGVAWLYIVALGTLGTLSQYYMTKAYGETKAGIIGAISYSTIIFSTAAGLLLGDAMPNAMTIVGIILITVAGAVVAKKQ
jgi:drug/metabolite transporter (DMT)-like permease